MKTWITQFYTLAKSKLTTYVALAIAALTLLADRADQLYAAWPQLAAYLPAAPWMVSASHYVVMALGFLVVYTRIRRLLSP
jgi:roadblock/LC7 domain-containing protein